MLFALRVLESALKSGRFLRELSQILEVLGCEPIFDGGNLPLEHQL
jgi:hypothetical protein